MRNSCEFFHRFFLLSFKHKLGIDVAIITELGKVTLKSNGDEALSDEFLLKSNDDEALNNVFP